MSQKITPGTYTANIIDYGLTETKAGDPQAAIKFEFMDRENDRHEITWYGSFKEKAMPWTIKTLLNCGMRGSDPAEIADGMQSGVLDAQTPVSIVVNAEQTQEGKTFMRVSFINKQGSALAKKLTKSDAKLKLGALNLKGAVMMAREETGIKDEPRPSPAFATGPTSVASFTDQDIPF